MQELIGPGANKDGALSAPVEVDHHWVVSVQVTENDSATASTHAAVLAPSGSATHVPPPAAHASSQLWPSAPSCQMAPEAPQAQSPPGR